MKFRVSFFPAYAAFAAASLAALVLSSAQSARAQRLPATVVPTHYTLALTPDLGNATFSGVESIDVNILHSTRTISLNAAEIKFQSVQIFPNGASQTGSVSLDSQAEQATFTFPETVPAGNATIRIHYTGILNDALRGFYLAKTERRRYAVTQFEPTDARRAFPCFDEPAFKAKFDISLTIASGDTAISNSSIVNDTPGPGAGKHTIEFGTTPKMSTYLVAFLVGDFQCTGGEQDNVSLRVCATPDKVAYTPFALGVAKFALHYYDDYFGIHYPLKKLDLIGVPNFEAGAMENFGAITFRETDLLIDPKTASLHSKITAALDIAHEMAHQWFGDLVTMNWWDNIWLNEGFATWMENKPVAAMHPEWNIPQVVAGDEQSTLNIDAQPTTRPIRAHANTPAEINQMFDSIAYGKASDVLLTVENYLGPEMFRKGAHAYLAAHEYGNADAQDFWNAQTETSHKPVDRIMESLVEESGVPILRFGSPSDGKVSVTQSRFYLSPGITPNPDQKWTLPVCFKTPAASQDCELLTPDASTLKVPAGGLFFANSGGKGYYRSAYAPQQLKALVDHVDSGLTPAERISLIGDEWAQVRANKSSVGDFLNLAEAVKSDSDAEVASITYSGLAGVDDELASTRQEHDALAAWIRGTFAPGYAQLGSPEAGDSPNKRELRAVLFGLLGYRGHDPQVITQARKIADQYLADPASVDPTLARAALGVAAENGNANLFSKLQNVYETSHDPVLQEGALYLLVQFKDPASLNRALEYAVSNKVRNQDSGIMLAYALEIPENRNQTWQFLKTHWDQVHAQLTVSSGSYIVAATGSFCSDQAHQNVQSFFADHQVAAADVALKHALEQIGECVEFRKLQGPNLVSWAAAQPGM